MGTRVPQFDRSDRLRKALQVSDVEVQEMADYLGVSRTSVSNWINGRVPPSKQTLRLWALRTGVPLGWLETGQDPTVQPGPEGARSEGLEPPTCWSVVRLVA